MIETYAAPSAHGGGEGHGPNGQAVREHRRIVRAAAYLLAITLLPGLLGCSQSVEQSPSQKAASEATAITESAQATAIVLRAQSTALAMTRGDSVPQPSDATPYSDYPPSGVTARAAVSGTAPAQGPDPDYVLPATTSITPEPTTSAEQGTPASQAGQITLINVSYAADGAYLIVNFKAPPTVARRWMQGTVYVIDEASGVKYADIPVMPVVGPLFGRPKEMGQPGYVMLVNQPGVAPNSLVTVVLGDFKQQHVRVQPQ